MKSKILFKAIFAAQTVNCRSVKRRFYIIVDLKTLSKFTGKHLSWSYTCKMQDDYFKDFIVGMIF